MLELFLTPGSSDTMSNLFLYSSRVLRGTKNVRKECVVRKCLNGILSVESKNYDIIKWLETPEIIGSVSLSL